ncbi:MAG: hypothetical protein GW893_05185 [Armatimonadetes bacterium]|nr:hypothetical protein [Armatimonadota bacterium]
MSITRVDQVTRTAVAVLAALLLLAVGGRAAWSQQDEIDQLKKAVADLQKRIDTLEEKQKKEAEMEAKAPKPVESGFGKIKLGGLMQNWITSDSGPDAHESYRLRRMELKVSGDINERAGWTVMFDPAKNLLLNAGPPVSANQRTTILQDAFMAYKINDNWTVDIGQEKLPLSLEGLQSSAKLDTVERALFMTGARNASIGYGDVRSLGIQLKGRFQQADLTLGLVNDAGELQNTTDSNDSKNITGRFVVRPPGAEGLQLGISGFAGGGAGATSLTRNRLGGEALYQHEGWTLKSEYMTGTDQAAAGGPDFDRTGWYFHVGKQLNPKWEAVARYDTWDPDEIGNGGVNPEEKDTVVGFNYLLEQFHAKLQLNYVHKNFDGVEDRNQILVNAQTAW